MGAGLNIRSLQNMSNVDRGLRTDGVVAFTLWPDPSYGDARRQALWERLKSVLAAQPGVTNVAAATGLLFYGGATTNIVVDGSETGPDPEACIGTLTAGWEWFKRWRTISGETLADPRLPQLRVLLEGACGPRRLLTLVRDFLVFEDDGSGALVKKMAGYHQFHAVQTAIAETLRAAALQQAVADDDMHGRPESDRRPGGDRGDRRIGVVWHTQGSGKSLTMAFYAGRIVREPTMENPTVVVLTDRNDLDDQLFTTFSRCADLLRQPPVQAESRADLRAKLAVESGGVVFTTIQKFFPEDKGDHHPLLSNRRSVVVIADEAHRSQYDFIDGYQGPRRAAILRRMVEVLAAVLLFIVGVRVGMWLERRKVIDVVPVPPSWWRRLFPCFRRRRGKETALQRR